MKWAYKGEPLANPFTILRRLICLPFLYLFILPAALIAFIGWGSYQAREILNTVR